MRCITLLLLPAPGAGERDNDGKREAAHECVQIRVEEEELMGQFRFRAIGYSQRGDRLRKEERGADRAPLLGKRARGTSRAVLGHEHDADSVAKHLAQGDVIICFVFASSETTDAEKAVPPSIDLRSWVSIAGPLFKLTQHGRFLNLTRRWHRRQFMLRDLWVHKVHRWNDADGASPRNYSGLASISPQKSSRLIGESPTKKKQKTPSPARHKGSVELDAPLVRAKFAILSSDDVKRLPTVRLQRLLAVLNSRFQNTLRAGDSIATGAWARAMPVQRR